MGAHFEPVTNAHNGLVVPPPTRRTTIGGYPCYDVLGEQHDDSNSVKYARARSLNV